VGFIVHKTTSELEHDLDHPIVCQCRKHRHILSLYFLHVQCRIQKVRGSRLMSHSILILFTRATPSKKSKGLQLMARSILRLFICTVPHTKSKGLPIDCPLYSDTFYMRNFAYSCSTIIILFIHINHRRMKSMGHLYTCIHHLGTQQNNLHTSS
jgi:hypothetical protein